MTASVHIVFRDFEATEALDTYVRRHVEKLQAQVSRLVSCNVAVESPHRHKQHGRHFRVRIDLMLPGTELVVDRTPEPNRDHEDAYAAIDDAFDHALRRANEHTKRARSMAR
jgi:ribosomal subunit interface protein